MLKFLGEGQEVFVEAAAIVSVFVLVLLTQRPASWLQAAERQIRCIAQKRGWSMMLVGFLAMASSMALSLLGRMPEPSVHDEFSYLLSADTFTRARLSNPIHPLWMHFESFHILQQPVYASKYPPAQGLILAFGEVVGGHPIVGIWLSSVLAITATYWMLRAWLPPGWALLGGGFTALHPWILHEWGQSYWGGTVAMFGGALVFGALRRIARRPSIHNSLLLGLGLAILANSRPYEGLVASVPVAAVLLVWMLRKVRLMAWVWIGKVVLPIITVLGIVGVAMGIYNWRLTGDVRRIPYQVYEATYASAPLFLWQQPPPMPVYRHNVMRDFYAFNDYLFRSQHTLQGLARMTWHKVKTLWMLYHGGQYIRLGLTIPLLALPWLVGNGWMRFALLTCGLFTVGLLVEPWVQTHYAAPITALGIMLVLQAARHIRLWRWRGRPIGKALVWTLVLVTGASFTGAFLQRMQLKPDGWQYERARLLKELQGDGRRHLVVVRYGPRHQVNDEWVYNEADIDGAKVVWAREMDTIQMRRLLEYFRDRQHWLAEIDVDNIPQKLGPYAIEMTP